LWRWRRDESAYVASLEKRHKSLTKNLLFRRLVDTYEGTVMIRDGNIIFKIASRSAFISRKCFYPISIFIVNHFTICFLGFFLSILFIILLIGWIQIIILKNCRRNCSKLSKGVNKPDSMSFVFFVKEKTRQVDSF